MATIETIYTGELHTEATHIKSGAKIVTSAPEDNNGVGDAFSPTDLVAAALTSCMLTIMGISAKNHGFSIEGIKIRTTKVMSPPPRRIGEIIVEIDFPQDYDEKTRKFLERSASECPVARSLHPDTKQTFIFNYPK